MDSFPEITVLVSVFNKSDTIEACVESLLKLKYPNKKVMIVEGFSKDDSYEKLKKYADKIELLQVAGNYSTALNWAFDKITSEYIAITDADCVVDPEWLNELLKGFDETDIIATAGYCTTPKDQPILQKIIGLELESRFRGFPKYLKRAPTMNVCFKTEIAKKVRFDEKLMIAVESDFFYRFTQYGRIKYIPAAIVWHYHRSDWQQYFKQQKGLAEGHFWVIMRHKNKIIAGDHVTTFDMVAQIPVLLILAASLILAIFYQPMIWVALSALIILLLLYAVNLGKISFAVTDIPYFILLFVTRNIAWTVGALSGVLNLVRGKKWLDASISTLDS